MEVIIIGLGSIAAKHIDSLKKLKNDVKITALRSSPDANQAEGITNIFSYDEIKNPDFAIISNPTNLHYEAILALAKKNIPMMIEKPPLHTLKNSDQLISTINDNKVFTYVACNLRFHPCITYLKETLSQKKLRINEVNIYCGSYLPTWRPNKNFRKVYSANVDMGGGVHLDLFHELDYAGWIFGQPLTCHSIKKNNSSLLIDAYDYANYILEYETFTVSIILNYYRPKVKRQLELVFENDIWLVDLLTNTITDQNNKIIFDAPSFTISDTYFEQMKYFVDCLNENKTPMNTLTESVDILKVALTHEF